MSTVGDQITGALRLLGVLAEGETASAETAQDALTAFNQMIDSWSLERLAVYNTQEQVITWPSGSSTQTLGPTGSIVGLRPVAIDASSYFKDSASGSSYGIKLIDQQQYNGIAVKMVTAPFPQVMFVNMAYPDIRMDVYPVPTQTLEFHIISVQELSQPATLSTELAFPPGYLRALKYNLACESAPEFGVEPAPQIIRIAMTSKRNLKRINSPGDIMALPYPLVATSRFNIYTGN